MSGVFLYKEMNSEDRDCVKYIELERLGKLECGHYFPSVRLVGSLFSNSLDTNEINYNEIKTILTGSELKRLDDYSKAVDGLKYGIVEGDSRYSKGIKLYEGIKDIVDKLLSDDNKELYKEVVEEEKEHLINEYSFNSVDVNEIFNRTSYQDRSIVSSVYEDIEDLATEEAYQMCMINEMNEKYFDFIHFGNDLLEDTEFFVELTDGRVVRLNA